MPYVPKDQRAYESTEIKRINLDAAGNLNYIMTKLCHKYLKTHGIRYQYFNDVIGALEGAKLELYRRFAGPYENECILKNGDVKELGGEF